MSVEGQTAIITGAAGGIGAASAIKLAEQGANITLVDLKSCEETAQSIKQANPSVGVIEMTGNIREESFVKSVVDNTVESFGGVQILVNNAGTCGRVDIEDMTDEIWDRDLETNVKAAFNFMKAVIYPHMLESKYGRIVNISSVSGINGGVLSSHQGSKKGRSGPAYAASKGALIALTKWVAKELGEYDITCNSVAPGATETGITSGLAYNFDQQVIKRMGQTEDIAEAVSYFANPKSGYTTAQTLRVDGGVDIG
ncbi:NAD(P)-dependent dehydrogenase (short-subunit alcohol dehydrogenase family) [Alkalibacillus filiformis]|uniref:NAD(P)-dependent dehydrogenase (Short-subunit alcohol dehydrogenase family) n=1 Tax=Alkalibacillus filiformis TaxID=200990 RepID=A0ABU0DV70_9BACI|nr:SDR family NAD(P)-dependent oxidoreductase [Alkalibacillus filiformis]MDQ0352349.1 NAD(P)-dependent dehydrogenase (short-subunit alcohol dehydrogenase family) [Alkalibacillus filiformis]